MSGPKRNPDKLNTIGVVVVGICGAVLVYVSIVALQAFYMNDSSEVQTMADYGGQDTTYKSIRTTQVNNIGEFGPNPTAPGKPQTYRVSIDHAIKLVVDAAKVDPAQLVPTQGRADKATVLPVFGRPKAAPAPAAPAPDDGSAATPDPGAVPPAAPMTPTGGQGQGGGAPPGTEGQPLKDPGVAPTPAPTPAAPKAEAPKTAPVPKADAPKTTVPKTPVPKAPAKTDPAKLPAKADAKPPAPKAPATPAAKKGNVP